MQTKIIITFKSDWQVGAGIGDGSLADSILARDQDGLIYIPGRALKGALREGAGKLAQCRDDLKIVQTKLFGSRSTSSDTNESGIIRVSPGYLPDNIRLELKKLNSDARASFIKDMTCNRIQTALENKQVKQGSLRSIECGMAGMQFEATIDIEEQAPLDKTFLSSYLVALCAATKSIGANRARGLGYCEIKVLNNKNDTITLPEEIKGEF